jgi:biotin carboxyl carrier protein
MKYTVIVAGERFDLDLDIRDGGRIQARIDGRSYVIESKIVEPGVYWFNWNNRSFELSVTPGSDEYHVSVSDRRISVEVLDSRTALRKAAHRGHDGEVELRAPMPGKVVKVLLQEGAEVSANQGILVMEAMKMQNEVKSPKAGTVKRVAVKEAVAVNAGDLLAVVE